MPALMIGGHGARAERGTRQTPQAGEGSGSQDQAEQDHPSCENMAMACWQETLHRTILLALIGWLRRRSRSLPTQLHSRLGFGTSGIMGAALTTGGRLKLLETAFEEGIRHFDTAPLYGQGEAESLLARFLGSKRDAITITTKFGLRPRPIPAVVRPLIPLARAVNRRVVNSCSPEHCTSTPAEPRHRARTSRGYPEPGPD
jgi:hypothetical protein